MNPASSGIPGTHEISTWQNAGMVRAAFVKALTQNGIPAERYE